MDDTESVASLSQIYLGNILYALELAAMSLSDEGRRDDAAFYRGIARKLAEARGREKGAAKATDPGSGKREAGSGRADT